MDSRAALLCLVPLVVVACGDPVRDDAIAALGPEERGVPVGPLHRPGQPCVLCHSEGGTSEVLFSFAGTVYLDVASPKPIDGVTVIIIDSTRTAFTATSNCAGNFYFRGGKRGPSFPVWVSMQAGNVVREMESPVYREGSCATCHTDPRSPASAGHVYLIDDPTVETPPPSRCN